MKKSKKKKKLEAADGEENEGSGPEGDNDLPDLRESLKNRGQQVWPITVFLFPFCKKIIDLPGEHFAGEMYFSPPFPLATTLSLPRTIEGLYEITRHPSRALNLNVHIASRTTEVQGHRPVCRTRPIVPGHHLKQPTQTLIGRLFRRTFFY